MDSATAQFEAAVYLSDVMPRTTTPVKIVEMSRAFVHYVERTVCCLDYGWPTFMKQLREHGLTMAIEIFTRETQYIVAEDAYKARVLFAVVTGMRQAGTYDPTRAGDLTDVYIATMRKHKFDFLDADMINVDLEYDDKEEHLWQKERDTTPSGNMLH